MYIYIYIVHTSHMYIIYICIILYIYMYRTRTYIYILHYIFYVHDIYIHICMLQWHVFVSLITETLRSCDIFPSRTNGDTKGVPGTTQSDYIGRWKERHSKAACTRLEQCFTPQVVDDSRDYIYYPLYGGLSRSMRGNPNNQPVQGDDTRQVAPQKQDEPWNYLFS